MNIKRADYIVAVERSFKEGYDKGKREGREEAVKEFEARTFNQRVECISKAATSLLSVTEAAARIASAAENITRWPR